MRPALTKIQRLITTWELLSAKWDCSTRRSASCRRSASIVDRGHTFPHVMQAYTWLAQCFLEKDMPEVAVRWYEKALNFQTSTRRPAPRCTTNWLRHSKLLATSLLPSEISSRSTAATSTIAMWPSASRPSGRKITRCV